MVYYLQKVRKRFPVEGLSKTYPFSPAWELATPKVGGMFWDSLLGEGLNWKTWRASDQPTKLVNEDRLHTTGLAVYFVMLPHILGPYIGVSMYPTCQAASGVGLDYKVDSGARTAISGSPSGLPLFLCSKGETSMPRKPAASAYILALTLRNVVRKNEERMEKVRKANQYYRLLNAKLVENGLPPKPLVPEDSTLYWASVNTELEGLKDVSEGLAILTDNDYRAIIFDAVKQPYNRVRKSKGFQFLVPELETLRRYGPLDERQPMDVTEDEARDLADLIWEQEMEPFKERGVDPINKQIIANKVAKELKTLNVQYLGEEIVSVSFNDVELDLYELDHKNVQELLQKGIECAFDLFDYDPHASVAVNTNWVRRAVTMYNSMLEKHMDDETVDNLTQQILTVFMYFQQLIE